MLNSKDPVLVFLTCLCWPLLVQCLACSSYLVDVAKWPSAIKHGIFKNINGRGNSYEWLPVCVSDKIICTFLHRYTMALWSFFKKYFPQTPLTSLKSKLEFENQATHFSATDGVWTWRTIAHVGPHEGAYCPRLGACSAVSCCYRWIWEASHLSQVSCLISLLACWVRLCLHVGKKTQLSLGRKNPSFEVSDPTHDSMVLLCLTTLGTSSQQIPSRGEGNRSKYPRGRGTLLRIAAGLAPAACVLMVGAEVLVSFRLADSDTHLMLAVQHEGWGSKWRKQWILEYRHASVEIHRPSTPVMRWADTQCTLYAHLFPHAIKYSLKIFVSA